MKNISAMSKDEVAAELNIARKTLMNLCVEIYKAFGCGNCDKNLKNYVDLILSEDMQLYLTHEYILKDTYSKEELFGNILNLETDKADDTDTFTVKEN